MFGKGLQLFKVFEFSVKADWSWLIVVVLMVWSLALRTLPGEYPNLSLASYLAMGIVKCVTEI